MAIVQGPGRAGINGGQRGDGEDSRNGSEERAANTGDDRVQALIFEWNNNDYCSNSKIQTWRHQLTSGLVHGVNSTPNPLL
jgi:hypothetical protein